LTSCLLLGTIAEHSRHLIEVRRDVAELVVTIDGDLRGEITFGHLLDASPQRPEWTPEPASQDEQRDGQQHRAGDHCDDRSGGAEISGEREGERRSVGHRGDDDDGHQHAQTPGHAIKMPLDGLICTA